MIDDKKPMIVPRPAVPPAAQPPAVDLAQTTRKAIVSQGSRPELLQRQAIAAEARKPMQRVTELRKATRYRLTSAAVIRWLGADDKIHEAFGLVHDISTCGVFVESTVPLRLTTNVELEITPPTLQPNASGLELRFEGKIVRAEKRKERAGFAVAGFLYVSRPGDPD